MGYEFRPAKRENMPLLIGLAGGTGSGKTFSAMRLARGLANGKRFAVIDTENGRAMHYADEFEFDVAELRAPFRPDAYADAIEAADKHGYPVIVVDSASHEHAGDGGLLDWHEEELNRLAGDDYRKREAMTFSAWIKPKTSHKKLVTRLLQLRAHVILCFRAQERIEIVKEGGKTVVRPKKTLTGLDGWVPISEKTLPYELTLSLLLTADAPGMPKPIKLQEQHRPMVPLGEPISEQTGVALAEWAHGGTKKRKDSGAGPGPTPNSAAAEHRGEEMTAAPAPETTSEPSAAELTAQLLEVKPDAEGAVGVNKIAHQEHPERHRQWLLRQLERAKEGATA